MSELLTNVLQAHGGLARWNQFTTVRAQIVTGGGLWALKGLTQDSAPRQMTVSLREEFGSVTPFGQPNWRTNFRPERLAIETLDGGVVRERENPRASFDGHTMNTPWDPLHRAYFNGYALWTYLTSPFLLALPGMSVRELEPVVDDGVEFTGFQVQFGSAFAGHSTLQEFYFGPDLLMARHDYRVDVAGGFSAIQHVSELVEANGIRVPTKRRAYRCDEDGRLIPSDLMVSIDLSDVHFS